jgi:hypothetical protein
MPGVGVGDGEAVGQPTPIALKLMTPPRLFDSCREIAFSHGRHPQLHLNIGGADGFSVATTRQNGEARGTADATATVTLPPSPQYWPSPRLACQDG